MNVYCKTNNLLHNHIIFFRFPHPFGKNKKQNYLPKFTFYNFVFVYKFTVFVIHQGININ